MKAIKTMSQSDEDDGIPYAELEDSDQPDHEMRSDSRANVDWDRADGAGEQARSGAEGETLRDDIDAIIAEIDKLTTGDDLARLKAQNVLGIERTNGDQITDMDKAGSVEEAVVAQIDPGVFGTVPPYQAWEEVSADAQLKSAVENAAGFLAGAAAMTAAAVSTARTGSLTSAEQIVVPGAIANKTVGRLAGEALDAAVSINANRDTIEHNINATIDRLNHPKTWIDGLK